MPVQILIDENKAIDAIISVEQATVEIIASVVRSADTIVLEGLHLERLSGKQIDRLPIDRLCEEVCRHYGVKEVIVHGALRTTGKSAGRMPKPIVYRMTES